LRGLVDAVNFLTRVPLGARIHTEERIARAVPWFPVVGAAVGLVIAAIYAGFVLVLPPLPAASIAVAFGAVLTGAFHEDGLADVADAFGGGNDREDRLRILKDPRLGTYGVLAIVMSMLIRVSSVASLPWRAALVAIPAAHALSRGAAIVAMVAFRPVEEGLGASYTRSLSGGRAGTGAVAAIGIAVALVRAWVAPGVLIAAVVVVVLGGLARRKIGGINGDVLGAIQQVTEVAMLVLFAGVVSTGRTLGW
jgi:adenosylcobinamide-GDP ribazoletransferase